MNEFVKLKQISAYLSMHGFEVGEREIRMTIRELIKVDGLCLQSSTKGYKLVRQSEDYASALKFIEGYIWELFDRRKDLKRNWNRQTAKLITV